jgi:hypothetical protein
MKSYILAFVEKLPKEVLESIFSHYTLENYGHIMLLPVVPLSLAQKRNALFLYLDAYITGKEDNEERQETLSAIVDKGDYGELQKVLDDQYFEEPLYHMANQGTIDYVFS